MRQCCQCGAEDRAGPTQPGVERPEHTVVPEIRYISAPEELTRDPRLARQGWRYRAFQGRHAMERMICRACMKANWDRDRVWAGMRAEARRLEQESEDNYYEILCEA